MPSSPEASPREAAIPPLPVRIAQAFFSPAKLFDALRERPAWIGAVIGLIVVGVAAQFLTPVLVSEEVLRAMVEAQFERFTPPGADEATQAQIEAQIDATLARGPVANSVTAVVATPITLAVISGLLLIAFNVVMGGEARFKQLFSASAHALFIYTAGGLVSLVLMAFGSENPILAPGLFLPEADGFIGNFLNGINVFSVWTCGVLGVAVSRIYPGRSVAAGTVYLLVLYLMVVAVLAALGSLLG
ncbi:YIP1 family protein [Candidatus Palauibacter sp.]|uniref:YIP1 family protein n=1 Tax=Candidatus Palauibacter sp. TaxID=3101350 RepID=UPI003B01771A